MDPYGNVGQCSIKQLNHLTWGRGRGRGALNAYTLYMHAVYMYIVDILYFLEIYLHLVKVIRVGSDGGKLMEHIQLSA